MGPTLKFEKDNIIAVTGADVSPTVNGEPIPMYQAVLVHAGDTLSFGVANGGSRAYIAILRRAGCPGCYGEQVYAHEEQAGRS